MKILPVLMLMIGASLQDKICTTVNSLDAACGNVARGTEPYECDTVKSKVSCVLHIDRGEHQFAVLDPEEALLGASFASDNVSVIGEIVGENQPYQTVVVVRKQYTNFESLRGKRFCHPGFVHDELVTKFVLNEFEKKIIDANQTYCENKQASTLIEKELSVLSNFFGSACRPGPWVEDNDDLDKDLKSKYSNLCDLCGPEKCNVNYKTPFNDSLNCLESGGDVAVTSLSRALVFLNKSTNADRYQYLCPNDTISTTIPCVWTKQLNRLIVTGRTRVNEVSDYLKKNLPANTAFASQSLGMLPIKDSLLELLKMKSTDKINYLPDTSLSKHVAGIRSIPSLSNNTRCKEVVNWCTLNDKEQQKCKWFAQAALNVGLEPVVDCKQSSDNDTVSCLIDLQNNKSDVMYSDVTYGYIALKKGLQPIAYPETFKTNISYVVIAVKNGTSIKSLNDLQGKQSCFPRYGGREWLVFIDTLRTQNIVSKKSCDYSAIFSDFVGSSCVPDARSKDFGFSTGDSDKLCAQCIPVSNLHTAVYCNADDDNKYYGTDGALRCLSSGAGEYAVITLKDIKEFNGSKDFQILAKNGSVVTTNFWFDPNMDDIALAVITSGQVLIQKDSPKKEDIRFLLNGIDVEFAQHLRSPFRMYERFNGESDLLFPDNTPGIDVDGSGVTAKYVENYKGLLKRSEDCIVNPNSAYSIIPSTILLTVIMLIVRF
ncbi:transferrin [Diabrotica virgifera virgifera]|uniref:Transferrin-like domain-containing protein n=1 Tax=Diabrotica virgifera virgifera TaxID=50390 RepID=A0ABM5IIL9_DIAVI|nr:transferrin [Diabrotica virgifera virgifera]